MDMDIAFIVPDIWESKITTNITLSKFLMNCVNYDVYITYYATGL